MISIAHPPSPERVLSADTGKLKQHVYVMHTVYGAGAPGGTSLIRLRVTGSMVVRSVARAD